MAEIIQNNLVKRLNLTARGLNPKKKKKMEGHSLEHEGFLFESRELLWIVRLYRQEVYRVLRTSIREIVDKEGKNERIFNKSVNPRDYWST